jgi:hypothetical protein
MALPHLNIAILGDTHGHLTLAYRILNRWQRETAQQIDLILQVGDLGAYPPPYRLDKPTKRFAEHDPDELGFTAYFLGEPEAEEILGYTAAEPRKIDADLIFIRGNHEDFEYLLGLDGTEHGPVAVDAFQRIHYLKSGVPFTYSKDGHSLCIVGLGGIADDEGAPVNDDSGACYTKQDVKRLFAVNEKIDLFLSHEPPLDAAAIINPKYAGAGSPAAREFIQTFAPAYHFCGHYHEEGRDISFANATRSYHLNAVNFWRPHRLNPGCIAILRWQGAQALEMSLLDAAWLKEYTNSTYRHL